MPTSVFAQGTIRIGLEKYFKGVGSITATNNDINVIANGKSYDVSMNGGYNMKHISKSYYKLSEKFNSYTDVKNRTTAYTGYSCIPAVTDNGWSLYFTTDKKPSGNLTSVTTSANAVVFANNGKNIFISDTTSPVQISSDSGILDLQKCKYRDNLELYISGNAITGINVIDQEHYLYGVVNSEMPSSWHLEAQKAQVVAARTYIAATGNKHKIYDLCDNTNCQDYNGTTKETENGIKAVNETAGKVAYYDNKPITAVYFSSDGGATFNSEDVWMSKVPYLVGFADSYEKECKQWNRTYTYSDITNMCNAKGFKIGTVNDITAKYNANGLCIELTFKGSSGSKTVTKEEIRTVFSAAKDGSLPSRNFVVNGGKTQVPNVSILSKDGKSTMPINSIVAENSIGENNSIQNSVVAYSSDGSKNTISTQSSNSNSITIVGKGFGHGVGMSQYGAKAMAESGKNYIDILKYYYKGIEVR